MTMRDDFMAVDVHPRRDDPRRPDEARPRPRASIMAAIVNQIDRMGVGAIPVVVLMSTIVGAIVAQQGAYQLRYFGAEIFVVDLVGILVLRETGRAVDGDHDRRPFRQRDHRRNRLDEDARGSRCADRHRAQSGRRAGLPAPGGAGDRAALPDDRRQFRRARRRHRHRLASIPTSRRPPSSTGCASASTLSTIFAGLIKAPFMALIIGIIGSVEGMKVGGSAESLGLHVTASVVKSIFVVILVDGLFAIFYAAIDF